MTASLRFAAPLLLAACSCASASPPSSSGGAAPVVSIEKETPAASNEAPAAPAPSGPKVLAKDAPLEEGRVRFEGMVRPTKGGYDVRGAILDEGDFRKALASAPAADPGNPQWLLGAVVRVDAELSRRTAEPPEKSGVAEQTRTGAWFQATRITAITVVEPARVIEGELGRSKGLFTLGEYMLVRSELDWALSPDSAKPGDRVRVHGQPRTYVCEPMGQCLSGGSIPFFDVGRARRLP